MILALALLASLNGHYFRSCYNVGEDMLSSEVQIQDSQWVQTYRAYEDEGCQKAYLIFETRQQAQVGAEIVDLKTEEVSYTLLSDEVARAFNYIGYCGFTNWKSQEKKVVTGLLCEDFQVPQVSQMLYSIFKLQTTVDGRSELYLGKAPADGQSPQNRHRELETAPYIKN